MKIEWDGWSRRAYGYSRMLRIIYLGPVTIYLRGGRA